MITSLLNQKGGVGKTTLATHLAGELEQTGQSVLLIVPNRKARRWAGHSDEPERLLIHWQRCVPGALSAAPVGICC